jgi:hypothetical protein
MSHQFEGGGASASGTSSDLGCHVGKSGLSLPAKRSGFGKLYLREPWGEETSCHIGLVGHNKKAAPGAHKAVERLCTP